MGSRLAPRLSGVLVLVVDDDPDALQVMTEFLRYYGAHVTTARSGSEALRHLVAVRADVIVTDYTMPVMNGVDLLGQIRKLDGETGAPTPAILCTAVGGLAAVARAAGFASYMVKPFDPQALVEEVARLAGV
jgi:CheY-like chemotaxis protein